MERETAKRSQAAGLGWRRHGREQARQDSGQQQQRKPKTKTTAVLQVKCQQRFQHYSEGQCHASLRRKA